LLLIDDFAIAPLTDQAKQDLLEILDDRYDRSATIITSQLDVKQWHLVHNAYHLDLSGDSTKAQILTCQGSEAGRHRGAGRPVMKYQNTLLTNHRL
jgi:hypothetical protein